MALDFPDQCQWGAQDETKEIASLQEALSEASRKVVLHSYTPAGMSFSPQRVKDIVFIMV